MNTNHAKNWQKEFHQPSPQPKKKIVIKVKKQSWITKGEKVIYAGFSLLLIIACLYLVSFSSKTDAINREVQTIQQTVNSQKLENEALHYEKSELSKPDRITRIARENGLKIQDAKVKRAITSSN